MKPTMIVFSLLAVLLAAIDSASTKVTKNANHCDVPVQQNVDAVEISVEAVAVESTTPESQTMSTRGPLPGNLTAIGIAPTRECDAGFSRDQSGVCRRHVGQTTV